MITRRAPDVLQDQELRKLLSNPENSKDKSEKIQTFYKKLCPAFADRIRGETQEISRRINVIDSRINELESIQKNALDNEKLEECGIAYRETRNLLETKKNLEARRNSFSGFEAPDDEGR